MARIRTIKPEFWDSPDTARASFQARLFYIAMWNWADDYGKGTASAKQLVGFAFPNDDAVTVADYPSLSKEVADCFGVVFYTVERRPYYAIPSFPEHQRTEKRAQSRIPDPPSGVTSGQSPCDGPSADSDGSSDATGGSSVSGTGEQGNRGTGERSTSASADAERDGFDEFWAAYPRKKDKGHGAKAYRSALKKVTSAEILEALDRERSTTWADRSPSHIPYPATWLNGEPWNDEPSTSTRVPYPQNGTQAEKEAWVSAIPKPDWGGYR